MTEAPTEANATPIPAAAPAWGRWAALGLLLLGEYLLVSVLFDAGSLREVDGWDWLSRLGILAPMLVVIAAATWVLGAKQLRRELGEAMTAAPGVRWRFLAAHIVCYGGLLFATERVFGFAETTPPPVEWSNVILCLAFALATGSLWLLSALRADALVTLVGRLRRTLLLGVTVGAAAWAGGVLSMEYLWHPLSRVTLELVVVMLRAWNPEVLVDPVSAVVGTPTFVVEVAPVCSGYEGIGLVTGFMGAYLTAERAALRLERAVWLVPLAVLTIYVANAGRIATLITVGALWSPAVALGGLHSKAGWVLVCAVCLGFVSLSRRWQWIWREPVAAERAETGENPTAAFLLPQLTLIGMGMVTGLVIVDFNYLYAVAPAAAAAAAFHYRRQLPKPTWPPNWQAPACGVAVFAMWWALEQLVSPGAESASSLATPGEEPASSLAAQVWAMDMPLAVAWLAGRVVGSVVVVPVVEELAFRGYFLRRLIGRDFTAVPLDRFTWLSFVVSSVGFGLLHQRWIAGTIAGMAFAGIQLHRGRIADAVVAHAVANALIALVVLAFGQWSMWG